ncbi:hypothetical protein ACP70R_040395 [Stipagrostis hirtigluma subsp. patula]
MGARGAGPGPRASRRTSSTAPSPPSASLPPRPYQIKAEKIFEFHVSKFHEASLQYNPELKDMAEGWDATTGDPDEILYYFNK